MSTLIIRGAEDFLALSKRLKAAGRKDLRADLNKTVRQAVRPITAATRAVASSTLPQGGGLAKLVAKSPQRIQVRTGAGTAGVRIVVTGAGKGADNGAVRHPVFGNRSVFAVTNTPSGWFTGTASKQAGPVRAQLVLSVARINQGIANG